MGNLEHAAWATAWATALSLIALALPLVLLVATFVIVSVMSLGLNAQRRKHAIVVLDRLVELAAVLRRVDLRASTDTGAAIATRTPTESR